MFLYECYNNTTKVALGSGIYAIVKTLKCSNVDKAISNSS